MPSAMLVLTTRCMPSAAAMPRRHLQLRREPIHRRLRRRRIELAARRRGNASDRDSPAPDWHPSPWARCRPCRSRRDRDRRRRSRGPTCRMPPASTRPIEPPPAPRLTMSRLLRATLMAADLAIADEGRLAVDDQADVGAGAAHVERDEIAGAQQLASHSGCRRRRRRDRTARAPAASRAASAIGATPPCDWMISTGPAIAGFDQTRCRAGAR